jgi:uncharacterized protein YbaR (Trm112 family)
MKKKETKAKANAKEVAKPINPKLFDLLVCPLTKGPLKFDAKNQELISPHAKLAYPIRDGVPIMLVDEARVLEES